MTTIHPIEQESYRILDERVDLSAWEAGPRAVVARVIHATADLEYAATMVVAGAAVDAGVTALAAGAAVIADVEMTARGITVAKAQTHLPASSSGGSTRAAAAMHAAASAHPHGAVFVVGCAPTALFALCELIEAGALSPALVIGLPVGFVGAADSKERLRAVASATGIPAISNRGDKGGSAAAAAACNALGRLIHG